MKALFYLSIIFLPLKGLSQLVAEKESNICAKISLSCDKQMISYEDLSKLKIEYKISNCGNDPITLNSADCPESIFGRGKIFFEIYSFSENGDRIYYHMENDPDPITLGNIISLPSDKDYVYTFPLFRFYNIRKPGLYMIRGFYCLKFNNNPGSYLSSSEELKISIYK